MHSLTKLIGSLACLAADWAQAADAVPAKRATAATTAKPMPMLLSAAGEGRRLYLQLNCYGCHGDRAAGGMGPNIVRAESGDVSEAVLQGEDGGMPHYRAYVTATDIANLTAYLQSIGSVNEPKFKDWWVPIPPK